MNEIKFLKEQIIKYKLDSKARHRCYTYKRFYIMHRLYKNNLSLSYIGRLLNRNHATVIHGIKMHRRWTRLKDQIYANEIGPIVAANNETSYEDKYRVIAIESLNYINLKIQMPYEYDKVNEFKDYMTAKELAKVI